ncbi:hypothetical protein, partial [Vibrio genomosp. F10]
GIGFPPFLGGPFRYIDKLGVKTVVEMLNQHAERYGNRFAPCDGLLTRAEIGESFYSDAKKSQDEPQGDNAE